MGEGYMLPVQGIGVFSILLEKKRQLLAYPCRSFVVHPSIPSSYQHYTTLPTTYLLFPPSPPNPPKKSNRKRANLHYALPRFTVEAVRSLPSQNTHHDVFVRSSRSFVFCLIHIFGITMY